MIRRNARIRRFLEARTKKDITVDEVSDIVGNWCDQNLTDADMEVDERFGMSIIGSKYELPVLLSAEAVADGILLTCECPYCTTKDIDIWGREILKQNGLTVPASRRDCEELPETGYDLEYAIWDVVTQDWQSSGTTICEASDICETKSDVLKVLKQFEQNMKTIIKKVEDGIDKLTR